MAFSKVKELLKKMPIFDQNWVNATFSTKLKYTMPGLGTNFEKFTDWHLVEINCWARLFKERLRY